MKWNLAVAALALVLAQVQAPEEIDSRQYGRFAPLRHALDGTRWAVEATPDELAQGKGATKFTGTLSFRENQATFTGSGAERFPPARCKFEEASTGGWKFRSTLHDDASGTVDWTGEVRGDKVRGVVVRTAKDGAVLAYTFEGAREEKSGTP